MKADSAKVCRLLKTARGQIDGILKMIDEDRYCVDISNQVSATEAILKKVNREILKSHMKCCVKDAFEKGNEDEKIEELVDLIEKMSK
ncbi:metal-sensing transcriptional repressor [Lachnospiraceae bacterium NSJ-143]|nr:metal-sensing transcriptional repressor [Lachnospiraceae bacterium NSJ-143]